MEWSALPSITLSSTFLFLFTSSLAYLTAQAVYNYFFHPLASFPGPKLCAITKFYSYYYDFFYHRCLFSAHILELHEQYGPVVRIAPNEVHIHDTEFYPSLFNFDLGLEKPKHHIQNLQHFGSNAEHKARRRFFDPYFSRASIQRTEPVIKAVVDKLTAKLSDQAGTSNIVDLAFWYRCLTLDIIMDFLLAQPYNLLDDVEGSKKLVGAIHGIFPLVPLIREFAWVNRTLQFIVSLPTWLQPPKDETMAFHEHWVESLGPRLERVKKGDVVAKKGQIIMMQEYLKTEKLTAEHRSNNELKENVQMFVGAGMETTGYALCMATYQILKHSNILQRLRAEMKEVWPAEREEIPALADLERLPLLTAVLKEAMRLGLGVTTRLQRVDHGRATQYRDWTIPPGCNMSMNQSFVLMDPKIFLEPRRFIPDRWLQNKELDKWFVPFSRGSRNCIGERLSWAEQYIAIAAVVHRLDMQLHETEDIDIYPAYDCFVPWPERDNGVRVKILKTSEERK